MITTMRVAPTPNTYCRWRSAIAVAFVLLVSGCQPCAAEPSEAPASTKLSSAEVVPNSKSPIAPAARTETIWEGDSAGRHVRWTTTDLTATVSSGQNLAFSLAQLLQQEFDHDMSDLRADDRRVAAERRLQNEPVPEPQVCTREVSADLLSLVGSLLSYRQMSSTNCAGAAHPDAETVFITLDLSREPPTPSVLSNVFPEKTIVSALTADKLVRRSLAPAAPRTLSDLTSELAAAAPVVTDTECYAYPDDLLTRFAFHDVDGARVSVRIGVPGAAPCRDHLTQLGLSLPIPPALRKSLALARTGQQGALMPQLEAAAAKRKMAWSARSVTGQ